MPPDSSYIYGLIPGLDVSRETLDKIEQYQILMVKWQDSVNLVSKNTIKEAQTRHFADSAQLVPLIPAGSERVMDIGSGAGFPGLVLKIFRPDMKMCLVESDGKKCSFMRTVARELELDVDIRDTRIEDLLCDAAINEGEDAIIDDNNDGHNVCDGVGVVPPDLITARALAPLSVLLAYCQPWAAKNSSTNMLFLKGKMAETEIFEARKEYDFDLKSVQSVTDPEGSVLCISNLCIKSGC